MTIEDDLANAMGDLMETIERNEELTKRLDLLNQRLEAGFVDWSVKIASAALAWVECTCGATGGDSVCVAWDVFQSMLLDVDDPSVPPPIVRSALLDIGRANLGDHGVTDPDSLSDGSQ